MALLEEMEQQGNWLFRYRGVLPITILFIGTILYARTEIYPETFILEETPYEIYYELLCLFISIVGLGIRVYTVGHTPANTSGRNTDGQLADSLNTSGIYSVVRHPLYLGNFFMWLGPALLTANGWFITAFCLIYWIYYERIMLAEEQYLRKKFGQIYTDWAEHTPAFIPALNQFSRPRISFSLKKVLKKEKNGVMALFVIFAFFDIFGEIIEHHRDFNYYLLGACGLSLLMYGLLKYLKHHTSVLHEEGR
jgi:protein-S-isoprenylcysteine O-methyltransferase Ste14